MAHAELDTSAGVIRLQTTWNQKSLVKQIPGARWDAQVKCWTLPTSWASLVTLRGVFQHDLVVGDKLAAWSWEHYRQHIEPALALRQSLVPLDDGSPEMEVIKSWRT